MIHILAALVFFWSASALAENLTGPAKVIDGDTIEIQGQRVRLFGIDAPEGKQTCQRDGQPWRCGQESSAALAGKVNGQTVTCAPRGSLDRYKRTVAICYVGEFDMNDWLVRKGWALAYRQFSTRYVETENEARSNKRGIWAGEFQPPWEWRQERRSDGRN